ncbi:MAG: alcohol dehydrogenase catalytic domain-containing protein [Phycisphaerae bacterium]|nr:alcohol dehydrogenase catalytic domain-containing protein [Phycisphaerae bacterium]
MRFEIPEVSSAVQLTGPDELTLNRNKAVPKVGPEQILGKVEAVGLCFSDLKLLKQFGAHARKQDILSGISRDVLEEIPSYVPDDEPTVPGHETVLRVVAMGENVKGVMLGGRYLVETDYRWLPTTNSNASFGYNFEGGLQQYVLMDQRVITSPKGELFLLEASEGLSASAVALVEPWACVEDAYAVEERTTLKVAGRMLVVAEAAVNGRAFGSLLKYYKRPAVVQWLGKLPAEAADWGVDIVEISVLSEADDTGFDDVVYFGSRAETAEALFAKVGPSGLLNIVQCGGQFGSEVTSMIGRVHYGNIRIIGTTGYDAAESMKHIPATGEIRPGDAINVVGAGGPMGVMHVIRNICQGVEGVQVYAGDLDAHRLGLLSRIAEPMAAERAVQYVPYNPKENPPETAFNYVALMAPVPALAAQAVVQAAEGAIINIFAGIPAHVTGPVDLDAYIAKHCYFIGTSGSVLEDMVAVLAKVEARTLDTDISVAAVTGLDGAVEGIRAVEKALIPGKILVYPSCEGLGLTPLEKLGEALPEVAAKLRDGLWNVEAEKALLAHYEKA